MEKTMMKAATAAICLCACATLFAETTDAA